MLYLGIDQHARQLTISLRNDDCDVVQARQVSTEPEKIIAFFQQRTREWLSQGESFLAVVEVCGFNGWLIRMLRDYRCQKVILIQPEERKRRKTDRRNQKCRLSNSFAAACGSRPSLVAAGARSTA